MDHQHPGGHRTGGQQESDAGATAGCDRPDQRQHDRGDTDNRSEQGGVDAAGALDDAEVEADQAEGRQRDQPSASRGRIAIQSVPRQHISPVSRAAASAPDGLAGLAGRDRILRQLRRDRDRGAHAHPDRIVIVACVAQALSLLSTVLLARGVRAITVEDPGSPGVIESLARSGMSPLPTQVDEHGLVVSAIPPEARAAIVTPAHQCPLGIALTPVRRRALIEWASEREGLVIEDDYDAELRYDKASIPALQAMGPDLVALTGSVSKTLSAGLRLGWLVLPQHLVAAVVSAKRNADLGCSITDQATLAELLTSGVLQRHIRRTRRRIYQHRRAELLAALDQHLPDVSVHGINAGLHLVLELESPAHEQAALELLTSRRISALALSATYRAEVRCGVVLGTARGGAEAVPDLARCSLRRANLSAQAGTKPVP